MEKKTRPRPLPLFAEKIGETFGAALAGGPRLLDALNALALLDEARSDTTLTELALAWKRGAGKAGERRGRPGPTVREFFAAYEARCPEERTCSRAAARSLGNLFAREAGADTPMECLRREDVLAVLGRYASPVSFNGMARRIRAALRWGAREGLCDLLSAAELPRMPEVWREPPFFMPDRVERIFRTAEAHPGPPAAGVGMTLSLGFFAGARSVEIRRAAWEDVDLEGRVLRITRPKGFTNGAKPRIVELEDNAAAWIARWTEWTAARRGGRKPSGPVVRAPREFAEWKKRWLEPAGDSWGRGGCANVMRHSYATHHVGAFRNAAATALNMGHGRSTDVLERHYRGLVARADAEKYWKIVPS